jgi:hypothetical protein
MLQGRNLIIAINGSTIAAAKSCSVDVQADTIKVSSPTDGAWEHIITGRKSWQVQTSHLMPNAMQRYPVIEASTIAWNEDGTRAQVTAAGRQFAVTATKGITLMCLRIVNGQWQNVWSQTYDTEDADELAELIQNIDYVGEGNDVRVLTGVDAFTINSALQAKIASALNIPIQNIPEVENSHGTFTAIGSMKEGTHGICCYAQGRVGAAHCKAYYVDDTIRSIANLLKTYIGKVGTEVTLRMQVDGYGNDYVTGSAIVTAFKSQGSIGNLLTGAFTFKGNGPLS